jgi:hypothetical protein
MNEVTANGHSITAKLPRSIEEFLVAQGLLTPRVVVQHTPLLKLGGRVSLCQ